MIEKFFCLFTKDNHCQDNGLEQCSHCARQAKADRRLKLSDFWTKRNVDIPRED